LRLNAFNRNRKRYLANRILSRVGWVKVVDQDIIHPIRLFCVRSITLELQERCGWNFNEDLSWIRIGAVWFRSRSFIRYTCFSSD